MEPHLDERVALITGPAEDIGATVSRAFAAEGCRLALAGRDTATIEPVADKIRQGGGHAIVVGCDLTDPAMCERAAARATTESGGINILVNVAGGSGSIGKTGVKTTPAEFDEIVTFNTNGCFHLMRAVLPMMITRRYSKVVNVGGTFGMWGRAGGVAYSASK